MRAERLLRGAGEGRRGAWVYALRTTNPPPDVPVAELDGVTRWLVVTRAAVLPMTLFSGLVAGLLGVRADGFDAGLWALATLGVLSGVRGDGTVPVVRLHRTAAAAEADRPG